MKKLRLITMLFAFTLAAAGLAAFENLQYGNRSVKVYAGDTTDTWSIITGPGWNTDVADLSWNADRNFYGQSSPGRFEVEYAFSANTEFKVRKDHDWSISVGYGGQTGQGIGTYLTESGENFKVGTAGTYLISLHKDVDGYGDKSYGFAIAKPYHVSVYNGSDLLKQYYFEDYNNTGFALTYSASEDEYTTIAHHTLEGLYTDSGLTQKFTSGTTTFNQSLNLYAKFDSNYTPSRYIVGVGGSWDIEDAVFMTHSGQYSAQVTLSRGDEIKIPYWNGSAFEWSYCNYGDITPNAEAYYCFTGNGGSNISVVAGGTYTFYYVATGDNYDGSYHISVAHVGKINAEQLAAKLMSFGENPASGHCGDNEKFPAMKSMFLEMDQNEKTKFQGFASSQEAQFKNAYDRYVAWAAALGQDPWTNSGSGARSVIGINNENSNTIAIIVIISLVSVTAIGGYFLIKRRQSN